MSGPVTARVRSRVACDVEGFITTRGVERARRRRVSKEKQPTRVEGEEKPRKKSGCVCKRRESCEGVRKKEDNREIEIGYLKT